MPILNLWLILRRYSSNKIFRNPECSQKKRHQREKNLQIVLPFEFIFLKMEHNTEKELNITMVAFRLKHPVVLSRASYRLIFAYKGELETNLSAIVPH